MKKGKTTTYQFSVRVQNLLEDLAKDEGVSRTKIIEYLVLKEAIKRGLEDWESPSSSSSIITRSGTRTCVSKCESLLGFIITS